MSDETNNVSQERTIRRLKWGLIGTTLLAILGGAGNATKLYEFFCPNGPEIVTSVDLDEFSLPSSLFDKLNDKLKLGDMPEELDVIGSNDATYCQIKIRNAGNLVASDLSLKFNGYPSEYFAVIYDDSLSRTEHTFTRELKLDELAIDETVRVYVWFGHSTDLLNEISVVHSSGKVLLWQDESDDVSDWPFYIMILCLAGWLYILWYDAHKESVAATEPVAGQLTQQPTVAANALTGEPQTQIVKDQPEP